MGSVELCRLRKSVIGPDGRAFVQIQYYKFKIRNKNGNYINFVLLKICGLHLLKSWTKNNLCFWFQVNKKSGYKLIYNSAKLSGRGERYYKQKYDKLYMPKKALKSGTQGSKNQVLKMHIDLTSSN